MVAFRESEPTAQVEAPGPELTHDQQARLAEIRTRAGRYLAEFLPREGGEAQVASFAGTAHWSHNTEYYEPMLAAPAWWLLGREGKRWRAALAILLLEAFGAPPERFDREVAIIAEFLHTASLIVDDIEDGAELRRGVIATHKAFGLDVALNAANAMYFLPLLTISRNPHLTLAQREELYRTLIDHFVRAHLGQANDLYFSTAMTAERLEAWISPKTGGEILQMYAGKTATWPMGLTEAAAIMADAPAPVRKACVDFAREFGVAFQIMDDVHGVNGMPGQTKTPGEDIITGKLTYLTHRALRGLGGASRDRLMKILVERRAASDPGVLAEAQGLIEASGAIAACRAEAAERFCAAWPAVTRALAPTPTRALIGALCAGLLSG